MLWIGTIQVQGGSHDEWLLVNVNQRGMYRVNYDDRNWEMIMAQLETLHTVDNWSKNKMLHCQQD